MTTETAPAISSQEHVRLTARAAALSVGVAFVLIGFKAWAWFASGSVAMLSSLADSTLDLAASLFTFFAVRYAAAPPDREHRFGHGKAEAFAGLMQSALVVLSAALIGVEAVRRLINPEPITHGFAGLAVMGLSIALTAFLIGAQTRTIEKTDSIATRGDRLHYASDLAANVVVMAGIAAGAFLNMPWADAVAGLLVALWLTYGSLKIARDSADHLLDRELPDADRARIRALAEADPRILTVHELRTRASGPYIHIQFHAELDPYLALVEAHAIVVEAENRIRAVFPTADVIIHPDPKDKAEPHGHEDFEPRSQGA